MRGSAAKQQQLSLNLHLLCGVLVSLSEDGAFIQQLYESVKIKWEKVYLWLLEFRKSKDQMV